MPFRHLFSVQPGQSVVTFTVFRFGAARRWWALGQMGRSALLRAKPEGLAFGKMMGSGRGGFSMVPDFSQYALLGVWHSQATAETFFASSLYQDYAARAAEAYTLQLLPTQSHGHWDGANPFVPVAKTVAENLPVVVLTRANIRFSRLPEFWRNVPKAQQAVKQSDGLLFSVGVGELPLVQQATVSIWQNAEAVKRFAYQQTFHKDIVQMTRRRNWYSEDLFARFVPVAVVGTYQGRDPLGFV
ncbi:MAG: hypothetical protein MUD08_13590 [Cytophagales bacterium]|nr:hypothetical protein [Cytophagales bacterium]